MSGSGRHLARVSAVQALYQWAITGQGAGEIEESFIPNQKLEGKYLAYFQKLIVEIPKNIDEIDALIAPHVNRDIEIVNIGMSDQSTFQVKKKCIKCEDIGIYSLDIDLNLENEIIKKCTLS